MNSGYLNSVPFSLFAHIMINSTFIVSFDGFYNHLPALFLFYLFCFFFPMYKVLFFFWANSIYAKPLIKCFPNRL